MLPGGCRKGPSEGAVIEEDAVRAVMTMPLWEEIQGIFCRQNRLQGSDAGGMR